MTLAIVMLGGMAAAAALFAAGPPKPTAEPHPPAERPADWRQLTVTSLSDAERLLDHLELCGSAELELVILGNARFAVRWR
jgi:hypothetical protein